MTENEIAKIVVDAAFKVHVALGPGLFESVYQRAMIYELRNRKLKIVAEHPISVIYDGVNLGESFRADIIVDNKVILELKSVEHIAKVHKKQLLTYLRLADIRLGLLINFGAPLIKHGITRVANRLQE
ncbi:MAG: GxxExxY protein [Anaerolineae bacterium]|jgi:GxxExxY protein|nr:GxxExxY protein [Anaerolineae bacterium]MBT7070851.1 GxxExxY protein [Anaerolineae bacterium]MBT7324355.1 GxxExxY protein [Anaerolineae bacterium]